MRGGLSLSLEADGRLILNLRYGAAKSWILGTRAERSRGIEWGLKRVSPLGGAGKRGKETIQSVAVVRLIPGALKHYQVKN